MSIIGKKRLGFLVNLGAGHVTLFFGERLGTVSAFGAMSQQASARAVLLRLHCSYSGVLFYDNL